MEPVDHRPRQGRLRRRLRPPTTAWPAARSPRSRARASTRRRSFVTGQDAELAGIQRILAGEQLMTVYQPIIDIAETSAELAVPIAQGKEPPAELATDEDRQRHEAGAVGPARHDRDHAGQHRRTRSSRTGFLKAADICTGRVRRRVQGGRRRVTPGGACRRRRTDRDQGRARPTGAARARRRARRGARRGGGRGAGAGGRQRCSRRSAALGAAPGAGRRPGRRAVGLRGRGAARTSRGRRASGRRWA